MKAMTYKVSIKGLTPLLLHNDNLQWAGQMEAWTREPANKKFSIAGDDRTPAWRWMGNLYFSHDLVCIPSDNLMTMLREGGAKCSTGKRQGTFKRQTQSGLVVNEDAWPIITSKGTVSYVVLKKLIDESDFEVQERTASELGFMLFTKRAKIQNAKHVRVRPRFDEWACQGTITVFDETISKDVLLNILQSAGTYCGLGDWRPSSPKSPGSFGRFEVSLTNA